MLNWGGFVNASFRVTDGERSVHVKLANEPARQAALGRWRSLREPLEAHYHAPPMLAWVELADAGCAGPVFERLPGESPAALDAALLGAVVDVVRALHADRALAGRLRVQGVRPPRRCADTYVATYHRRFVADLGYVAAGRPPFVSDDRLAWMRAEVAALARLVRATPAFRLPADSPVHADLWVNNLVVAPDGRWWLLDWDDLTLGDPALDVATLTGPTMARLEGPGVEAGAAGLDDAARARLAVYARAALLDWVIDPLADWLAAEAVPERLEEVRGVKQRVHEDALALYLARFGDGKGDGDAAS